MTASRDFTAVRGDRAGGWLDQTRSEVVARNGVVATSQPLAAQAGLQILKHGGNAFDAAVAAAAVLNVVEPAGAGLGGDAFVLAWLARESKLVALNGSGRAPAGSTPEYLGKRGHAKEVPRRGIHSVSVPGAVDAWDALLRRAGTLTFQDVLEPAAALAEEGFGITQRICEDWSRDAEALRSDSDSAKVYLVEGEAPRLYSTFRNPELARALRVLQAGGAEAFYRGEIARAIVAKSQALGGALTLQDLAETQATWDTPLATTYQGFEILEMPPNTQGLAALEILNILEAYTERSGVSLAELGPRSSTFWHLLVEAKKLAYADLYEFNADPAFAQIPLERLISKAHARQLCARIDLRKAATPESRGDPVGGTVYIAAADRWGNMVSFIYSIYEGFGSGVTIPGYGFVLNNRGALFSLDPRSPNLLAPRKRPFQTILPGFLMRDAQPVMAFGLMGGGQQAQGHAQVLVSMLDLGANPQAASDAARFAHWQASNTLNLESALFGLVGAELRSLGHEVVAGNGLDMGGFQAVWFDPDNSPPAEQPPTARAQPVAGVYRAASDHRKDGCALGW
ncbi:MAG TPA: gamma-glutamyltransferase [Steroidobacteraceae bacterium]|jgi:gamma-glutamyltranspeptidase/glutathione hydrolase